jgi:hypothetical protein
MPEASVSVERRRGIESYLDSGAGQCWLSRTETAETVEDALPYFEGQRYQLEAWMIIANRVHALFTPQAGHAFSEILHSWKSYTSNVANRLPGRSRGYWYPDCFDRFIRDADLNEMAQRFEEELAGCILRGIRTAIATLCECMRLR